MIKKICLILLLTIFFTAAYWMGTADRLPQQVPENQAFTIDTLIDATGSMNEESEMEWTIESGDTPLTGVYYDTGSANVSNRSTLSSSQYEALLAAAALMVSKYGGEAVDYLKVQNASGTLYLNELYIPDNELDKIVSYGTYGGQTWRQLLAAILSSNSYYQEDTDTLYAAIHDSKLYPGEETAIQTWTDTLRSNGGKISLNKNIDFDSKNKGKGLSNLEAGKVLTYASTEGTHLVGSEAWLLDVAGNWEKTTDSIRCVFADAGDTVLPAFCNVVKAKSELVNFNSGQVSTKGSSRTVAATGDVPTALGYQVAVSPDSNSGSGFADGTIKTLFGGSIMEAHGKNQEPAATNNWRDTDSVTGGIKTFQKTFGYESGITGPGDKDNDQVTTITPAPTQGTGTITVTVYYDDPPGPTNALSFTLTGGSKTVTGTTPATLTDMPAGTYTVTVTPPTPPPDYGCEPTSGTLSAGGTLTLNVRIHGM